MVARIRFTVPGRPRPAGSKRAFVQGDRAIVVDANPEARDWKALVADFASQEMNGRPLLSGPLRAWFTFYFIRPKSHYGTGRNADKLKSSAPSHPTGPPDALKLSRGTEDAMQGVVYRNDSQIVSECLYKEYGPSAQACIHLEEIA